mgnify:CR=1 FL=1
MAPIAAVMTGGGTGAIATIQLFGESSETVLWAIFRRADPRAFSLTMGRILLGEIVEGDQAIDQVTVGCEGPGEFAIHCHGNPLIVGKIMDLLRHRGVQPVRAEQFLARVLMERQPADAIGVEAKLTLAAVKTIEGTRIVANQTKAGLAATVRRWQANLDSMPLERIAAQAEQILRDSGAARLILSGCTIALVGPPNTGKSTLLNALAGREKALVTDIAGTTRDWVSAEVRIPPLVATVIDTAGLNLSLAAGDRIDEIAQQKSVEALNCADLVLLVLDASEPAGQLPASLADLLVGRRTIAVLNKADLPQQFDPSSLPDRLQSVVRISAKRETGIADLAQAILRALGLECLSPGAPVAFTERQRALIRRLAEAGSRDEMACVLADLLHGQG